MHDVSLILHNIRSAHNVGSIFRTADGAGVSKVYLCGYTPDPVDRFGRERSDIAKVSLGAEKTVKWEHRYEITELIAELKQQGVVVLALEQHERSIDYASYQPDGPVALILGNEPDGVEEEVLSHCDAILEIPMRGSKESLNVSVAAGVALYQLINV